MDHGDDATGALGRISEALGRPTEAILAADPAQDALAGAVELLRLWRSIPSPRGRLRVLAAARREAGEAEGAVLAGA